MGMEGWDKLEWDQEETKSWNTGGFGAAARRLSDDHIKGNSVNTFLCKNGNVSGSITVKLTQRGFTRHSPHPV